MDSIVANVSAYLPPINENIRVSSSPPIWKNYNISSDFYFYNLPGDKKGLKFLNDVPKLFSDRFSSSTNIFVDGSVFPLQGVASAVCIPGLSLTYSESLNLSCDILFAELYAIFLGIKLAASEFFIPCKVFIFSDSLRAIEIITFRKRDKFPSTFDGIFSLLDCSQHLDVQLVWLPAHCGVWEADTADRVARGKALGFSYASVVERCVGVAGGGAELFQNAKDPPVLERCQLAHHVNNYVKAVSRKSFETSKHLYFYTYGIRCPCWSYEPGSRQLQISIAQLRLQASVLKADRKRVNLAEDDRC
jgi:ribonuclease HI